jgi:tetratricopeptide (TPR) repeat protein
MRANIFVKKRFFQRAYSDLQFVLAEMKDTDLDSQTYVIYILLAKCENQFGNVSKGIEYLRTGLAATKSKLTSSSRADLYLELVINYLTISDVKNIEKYMSKIFLLNEGHGLAHGYNGLFHQNRGEAAKSMVSYHKVLEGNPKEIQSMHFIGLGYFAQGKYLDAMTWFDKPLEVDPNHYAWCLKEMAWYRLQKLDTALDNYNPDTDLHWLLRDAWIRRSPKSEYCRGNFCHKNLKLVSQADIRAVKSSGKSISIPMSDYYDSEQSDKFRQFLNMTSIISSWIQVDSPGFLIHKRLVLNPIRFLIQN